MEAVKCNIIQNVVFGQINHVQHHLKRTEMGEKMVYVNMIKCWKTAESLLQGVSAQGVSAYKCEQVVFVSSDKLLHLTNEHILTFHKI